jgi:hypothetical protein
MRVNRSFLLAAITLCLLLSTMTVAQDAVIKKVGTPITIDATIDAVWENAAANITEINMEGVGTGVDDTDDLSAIWKALWDDNNFYMLVVVTDDENWGDTDGVNEHDDGFDIMFDTDNEDESVPDVENEDDFMLMVEYSDDGDCPVAGDKGTFPVLDVEGVVARCVDTDAGYTVEISIPLVNLGLDGIASETIGFGFRINDDDDGDGRDGQVAWFIEAPSFWNVPSALADVELSSEMVTGVKFDDLALQVEEYNLAQNYPNPFNPATHITYALKKAGQVKLTVYNMLGNTVATLVDGNQTAGTHSVQFDASDLSSGVYFYKLQAGSNVFTRKMMLIK